MVGCCAAANCGSRMKKGSGISFHRFPLQNPELLAKWLSAIQRDNFEPTNNHKLCSEHFTEPCFWKSHGKRLLKNEAVPTIFKYESTFKRGKKSSCRMLKKKIDPVNDDPEVLFVRRRVANNHNYTLSENEMDTAKSKLNQSDTMNDPDIIIMNDEHDSSTGKLKLIIARLKTKGLIDKHTLSILNNNFSEDMFDAVYRACGEQNSNNSDILQKFAVTLYFYCPAAYKYLRQSLDRTLPQVSLVRKWCMSPVADPGFTEQAFKVLEEHLASSTNTLYVSLTFDEVPLQRAYEWDGNRFVGCVDLGDGVCVNDCEEAREVLVLMVVAVNASWKIPIGYYLVNRLSANVKANILREAILRLQNIKLNVLAVTCKGENSNLVVGEKLGCNFMAEALDCSFTVGKQNIQFMLDPFHMRSLVRSLLCEFKILKDQNGDVIDYRYIELLQDHQQNEHDVSPGRPRKKSIESLEDSLALQVPSVSIGKALQNACTEMKLKQFEGAIPTAEFCMFFDKLFTLFTSKSRLAKGYKAVLSARNKASSFNVLDYAESYLLGMKDNYDRPLYHTTRRIAIIGFLSLCRGIRNIYMEVVETKEMNYLATYKFSVENLELFVNRIQNKLESSHPTALQFKEAYKVLVTSEVRGQDSESANEGSEAMEY